MVFETKYGVISDIHSANDNLSETIDYFKSKGVKELILNGDIADIKHTLGASQDEVANVLKIVGESNLFSYVQPGSHETVGMYAPVMTYFTGKYGNILNMNKIQKVKNVDHDLIFIPGSDFHSGGEYSFGDELDSGLYVNSDEGIRTYAKYLKDGKNLSGAKLIDYHNINEVKKLNINPDNSIVICHVPRKFDSLENAVDVAYFASTEKGVILPGIVVENMIKKQFGEVSYNDMLAIANHNGYELRVENRGNEKLAKLYGELGIKKAISGHFHESAHKAHDLSGKIVEEGQIVDELFWNSGCYKDGQTGILTVNGNKASYENIKL